MADVNHAAEKNPLVPQDWGVWAEINYLDSPTEYREYLPNAPLQNPATRGDFVLLSASGDLSKGRESNSAVIICLIVALFAGCSVYAFMNLP